jgi:hypothetical protein
MLKLKRVDTYPVKVEFEHELFEKGSFIIGDGVIRSRKEMEELREWINTEKPKDEEVIPKLYKNLHGVTAFEASEWAKEAGEKLTGQAAFREVCEGKLNSYLMGPCIQFYFQSFDAAKAKN